MCHWFESSFGFILRQVRVQQVLPACADLLRAPRDERVARGAAALRTGTGTGTGSKET